MPSTGERTFRSAADTSIGRSGRTQSALLAPLGLPAASSAAAGANSTATLPDLASIRRLARDLYAAPTCVVAGGVHGALGGAGSHLQVGEGSSSDLAEAEFVQLSMAASVEGCAVRARRDIADSAAHEVLDMLQTEWATQLIKTLGQTIVMQILSPFILSFVTALMPAINEMLTPQVVSECVHAVHMQAAHSGAHAVCMSCMQRTRALQAGYTHLQAVVHTIHMQDASVQGARTSLTVATKASL